MILFLGFMVCCLGICVSLLARKVRELEYEFWLERVNTMKEVNNILKLLLDQVEIDKKKFFKEQNNETKI